ncbi:VWA domain-containing protein [bacterium]|nr:VWA domain-containing protein [bacterium]
MKRLFIVTILLLGGLLLANTLTWADGIILPPVGVSISIKYHIVNVEITDQVATTFVDQVFINEAPFQIEGTYIFPLSEGVSVSEFAMFVDGERLEAEMLDSEKAKQIYEDIVRRRNDPALLEYMGGGMFRARVFPIPAKGEKRIQLEYSEILKADAGLVKYQYPLNTEKFSHRPLEKVSVSANLHSTSPLKAIYSPSHQITVNRNGEHDAEIKYVDENVKPDRDFLFYYTVSLDDFGLNLLTHRTGNEDGFYLLMLAPKPQVDESEVADKNIVFVFDTSGSMRGEKIEQAKEALKFGINTLRAGDFFNIIDFSTEARKFRDKPVTASGENIQAALKHANAINATGGTNINEALLEGLRQFEDTAMIVFLTDGQPTVGVTNNDEITKNVRANNAPSTRLFVFGVGYDVNTHLLDILAAENSGVSEYVRPEENIEVKVSAFFSKISNPVLSKLKLDMGSVVTLDVYPKQLPDLFAGMQLIQLGRYKDTGNTAITLTGEINSQTQQFVYESTFAQENAENEFLPRLWATRKVGYLLDQIRLNGENQELVDEIVSLGKLYGIITPYTSFLITEDEPIVLPPSVGPLDLSTALDPNAFGKVTVGKGAIDVSVITRGLGEAETQDAGLSVASIKTIGRKTFILQDDFWTDTEYQEGRATVDITYGGRDYFDLIAANPELGRYFALGQKVIVGFNGVFYRVEPGELLNYGDVNEDGSVGVDDAILILQSRVKLVTLTQAQQISADVNGDGDVTTFDAFLVMRYAEGIIEGFPVEGVTPAAPEVITKLKAQIDSLVVSLSDVSAKPGQIVSIPLRIDNTAGISAGEIGISYDANRLKFINVSTSSLTAGYPLVYNIVQKIGQPQQHVLNIALAGGLPINRDGAILKLEFRISSKIEANAGAIPINLSKVRLGEGNIPVITQDGSIKILPNRNLLLTNYPNPFNPETWIPYQLAQNAEVTISIYNTKGQLIRTLNLGVKPAGMYVTQDKAASWDGMDKNGEGVASGLYFYTLKAGSFKATRKMLVMK